MGLTFAGYLSDDTTLATGLTFSTTAGVESSETVVHLWASKGTAGGSESNVYLELQVLDAGVYKNAGVLALDEYHFSISVTGYSNPSSDSSFQPQVTGYQRIGTNKVVWLLPFVGNSARYISVRYRPKLAAGVATESISWKLRVITGTSVIALANGVGERGHGILRMLRDYDYSGWVTAPVITAQGSPDATVNVSRCKYVGWGHPHHKIAETVTLNQTDGSAGSLTTGQAYWAILSQPIGVADPVTVTKGTRAASSSATRPTMPADELYIGEVKVLYHSGASVINTADITNGAQSGRFVPEASTGLAITVGHGQAYCAGAHIVMGGRSTVALTASVDNEVWLTPQGAFLVDTGGGTPPIAGALWIATATTSSSAVTSLTDRRGSYMSGIGTETIRLVSAVGNATTGDGQDFTVAGRHYLVDEIWVYVRTASSGGATGSTTVDVEVAYNGGGYATLFSTTLPAIPAGSLSVEAWPDSWAHIGNTLIPGDYVRHNIDSITTSGTREKDPSVVLTVCQA